MDDKELVVTKTRKGYTVDFPPTVTGLNHNDAVYLLSKIAAEASEEYFQLMKQRVNEMDELMRTMKRGIAE